jgi:hypothetical protein
MRRHLQPDRFDCILRHVPDGHCICGESGFLVAEDCGISPHYPICQKRLGSRDQLIFRHSGLYGKRGEWATLKRQIALQCADSLDVLIAQLEGNRGQGTGNRDGFLIARHIESYAYFENPYGWEHPDGAWLGLSRQLINLHLRCRLRQDSDREPEIVSMIPLIVVADAGMGAHYFRNFLDPITRHTERDKQTLVTKRKGIEYRADLPDESFVFQDGNAMNHLGFRYPKPLSECRKWLRHNWEIGLEHIEQLAVYIVH